MVRIYIGTALLCAMLASGVASARDYGRVSETDGWVRIYDYSEQEVYALKGYYGFTTLIFFRSDEEIVTISSGDSQAWDITTAQNKDFIFIKPTLDPPVPTNMTVITDRRVYLFDLQVAEPPDPDEAPEDLTLKVFFSYPEPAGPNRAQERRLAEEQRRQEEQAREDRQRQLDRDAELEALRLQRAIQEDERRRAEAEQARQEELARLQREEDARLAAEQAARAEAEAARQRQIDRLNAPSVIFDNTTGEEDAGRPTDAVQPPAAPLGSDAYLQRLEQSRPNDLVFLEDAAARASQVIRGGGSRATRIRNLDQKVLQGAFIMGNLETAIDSSLSGMLRAVVSETVWSSDGTQVLIPRGSRLIGQYTSEVQFGATRVLVAWTRLIRPDGLSLELGSPSTDGLGRAGIPGIADTHFATRFGTAALVSVIAGGSAVAVGQLDESATQETGNEIATTANDNFTTLLDPYLNIPTTIHVHQGAQIIVYVARDLDFQIEDL